MGTERARAELTSPDWSVRVEAIGRLRADLEAGLPARELREAREALLALSTDPWWKVRQAVVSALAVLPRSHQVREALEARISDENHFVRATAARVLQRGRERVAAATRPPRTGGEPSPRRQQAAAALVQGRHRLEFCAATGQVSLGRLVTFGDTSARLLQALRDPFLEALARDEVPGFVPSASVALGLGIEPEYLRKTVERVRRRIATAFMEAYGLAPEPGAIIESRAWHGYRLNPRTVDVAVQPDTPAQ